MTSPPVVCPRPGPHNPGPDCPLWDARQRIRFERSIEAEADSRPSLGQLVWADFNRGFQRPSAPPTRPLPVASELMAALTSPSTPPDFVSAKAPIQKGKSDA